MNRIVLLLTLVFAATFVHAELQNVQVGSASVVTWYAGELQIPSDCRKFVPSTKGSDWQKPTSNRVPKGHIAIQNHGDRVEFRNIAIIDWDAIREANAKQ